LNLPLLRAVVAAVPYTIHTVLTDNGTQFTDNWPVDDAAEAQADAYRIDPTHLTPGPNT